MGMSHLGTVLVSSMRDVISEVVVISVDVVDGL